MARDKKLENMKISRDGNLCVGFESCRYMYIELYTYISTHLIK